MTARVFISYSKQSPEPTRDLASFLAAEGFSVWWDTDLYTGQDFSKEIQDQLDAAAAVIVIWTPASIDSRWVRAEATYADGQGKLIPVYADGVTPARVPPPFNTIHSDSIDNRAAILRAIGRLAPPPREGDGRAAIDGDAAPLRVAPGCDGAAQPGGGRLRRDGGGARPCRV